MESIQKLKKKIYECRPILKEIMTRHGKKRLYDYARDYLDVNPAPELDKRKTELISVAQEVLQKRLGKTVAKNVVQQLKKRALVSTADHHGIIGNQFSLNSNIIGSLHYQDIGSPGYLAVFSFSCISLNNSSYPRCLEFHARENGEGKLIRIPLLQDKLKRATVYGVRAITKEDVARAEKELLKHMRAGDISDTRAEKIQKLLNSIFLKPEVLKAPDLKTQITIINYNLWPHFFATKPNIPNLIYLEIETLAKDLLIKRHLLDATSPIYRMLFDESLEPLLTKHFHDIPGGLSSSYFFWGLDEQGHRLQIQKGGYPAKWSPKSIAKALKNGQLYSGTLLCHIIISFYYGMKCLGGFNQVHNLTIMKRAWQDFLADVGEINEVKAVESVQTKEFGGDGAIMAFFKTADGNRVNATGLDLYLQDKKLSIKDYAELARKMTLEKIIEPMLPSICQIVCHQNRRA